MRPLRRGVLGLGVVALLASALALALWPSGGSVSGPSAAEAASEASSPRILSDREVLIGVYIANIQAMTPETNSFMADFYVWLRWTDDRLQPQKSFEFTNLFEAWQLMSWTSSDEPERQPDGSLYFLTHYQGAFNSVLSQSDFPFGRNQLHLQMEDIENESQDFRFVVDDSSISIDKDISIPGFRISEPSISVSDFNYPTDFGSLDMTKENMYSRVVASVTVDRPVATSIFKYLVPIILVMLAAGLIFQVPPSLIEGRIGLAITALLTLVAMQWTATDSLPVYSYLTMLDVLYLVSLGFILASLVQAIRITWIARDADEAAAIRLDERSMWIFYVAYAVCFSAIITWYALT